MNFIDDIKNQISDFINRYILSPIFNIKCLFHRARYGWSEKDIWSLDTYITDVVLGTLKFLVEKEETKMARFDFDAHSDAHREWIKDIKDVIEGFEKYKSFDIDMNVISEKLVKEYGVDETDPFFISFLGHRKKLEGEKFDEYMNMYESELNTRLEKMKKLLDIYPSLWN